MMKLVLVSLATLLIESSAYGALVYSVTDLGTLGGNSSYGTAINDNGTAVGYSLVPGGATHAFRWTSGGGMQDLGVLGAGSSRAFDVNNNENVVGQTSGQSYRWTSGSGMVLLDNLSLGSANDLNENDEAVGTKNGLTTDDVVLWSPTNVLTNPFPLSDTRGAAMNGNGNFVGTFSGGTGGFYSADTNSFEALGAFIPTDINDSRQITGSLSGVASLFDYDTMSTTLLGKLSFTDTSSIALGINPLGDVVGTSGESGGFLFTSSMGLQSLTSLLRTEDSGWTILAAEDINNMGYIVGVGRFNGQDRAVLLTPVPEPTTALLASLALFSTVRARRAPRRAQGAPRRESGE